MLLSNMILWPKKNTKSKLKVKFWFGERMPIMVNVSSPPLKFMGKVIGALIRDIEIWKIFLKIFYERKKNVIDFLNSFLYFL